jgi:hypothetical protein
LSGFFIFPSPITLKEIIDYSLQNLNVQ